MVEERNIDHTLHDDDLVAMDAYGRDATLIGLQDMEGKKFERLVW